MLPKGVYSMIYKITNDIYRYILISKYHIKNMKKSFFKYQWFFTFSQSVK